MDKDCIEKLIQLGKTPDEIMAARAVAAQKMGITNHGASLPNGCAATLCALLQKAGIPIGVIPLAGRFVTALAGPFNSRNWDHIPVGAQQPGDIGVTYDLDPTPHGADHVYLVLKNIDGDKMLIADNQDREPHYRLASGGKKTPTDYFLRAPGYVPAFHQALRAESAAEGVAYVDFILKVAAESPVARYAWKDRGRSPVGYVKGMALAYAQACCRLKEEDPVVLEMAKADTGDADHDALAWLADDFVAAGLPDAQTENDRLRRLFVLLMGLGMRESSGSYCEGRDLSAENVTADTAEAGLFQTSWNARKASRLMPQVYEQYKGRKDLLEVFREGVHCSSGDLKNYGDGDGAEFQRLSKECPAFAVAFAALGLRNIRKHWGPVNRKKVEILPICDNLLRMVEQVVDRHGLCGALTP